MKPVAIKVFPVTCIVILILLGNFPTVVAADKPKSQAATDTDQKEPDWNIEKTPGKTHVQPIDTTEGTWITVDVHPDGTRFASFHQINQ